MKQNRHEKQTFGIYDGGFCASVLNGYDCGGYKVSPAAAPVTARNVGRIAHIATATALRTIAVWSNTRDNMKPVRDAVTLYGRGIDMDDTIAPDMVQSAAVAVWGVVRDVPTAEQIKPYAVTVDHTARRITFRTIAGDAFGAGIRATNTAYHAERRRRSTATAWVDDYRGNAVKIGAAQIATDYTGNMTALLYIESARQAMTARQFQTFRLLLDGHTVREIAARLNVSTRAAQKHIEAVRCIVSAIKGNTHAEQV